MDNRTIRRAVMRRCPEVYFISKPVYARAKVHWLMYAKIPGIRIPVELRCDMPDTAIISFNELLTTMVNEIYDEIKALSTGRKNLQMDPDDKHPPLSAELQKVFDSPDIQYYSLGAPNDKPKKSSIILPP